MSMPKGYKWTEEQKAKLRGRTPWNKGLTKHTDKILMSISKKTTEQMNREYKSGIRNGKEITKKCHEKTREMVKDGTHPLLNKNRNFKHWSKGLTKYDHPSIMKISEAKMGDKNPVRKYPEKHPNRIMARSQKTGRGYISKGQWNLFHKIKEKFPDAEINFRVRVRNYVYFVDIAIPSHNLIIEYDGGYWHQDKEADIRRQKRIESLGLKFMRVTDKDDLDKFIEKLCRSTFVRVV